MKAWNQLSKDIQIGVSCLNVLTADMVSQCSSWEDASAESTGVGQGSHQRAISPKFGKITLYETLLQLQSHRRAQVRSHDSRQALLIKLPWHKQVLSHVNSHHA